MDRKDRRILALEVALTGDGYRRLSGIGVILIGYRVIFLKL